MFKEENIYILVLIKGENGDSVLKGNCDLLFNFRISLRMGYKDFLGKYSVVCYVY